MAKGNLAPRQKMINLMYLVFIAMLAMQIDQEILKSLKEINFSMENSVELTNDNTQFFYKELKKKSIDEPESYEKPYANAMEIKGASDELVDYINNLKLQLGSKEIKEAEEVDYNKLQNTDDISLLFFKGGDDNKGNQTGQDFVKRLKDYTNKTKSLLKEDGKSLIEKAFNFEDKNGNSWLNDKFYNQPIASSLANLTKIQSDVRTVEAIAAREFLDQDELEFDGFAPIISSPGVVKIGTKGVAQIGLGKVTRQVSGSVNIQGYGSIPIIDGIASINLKTGKSGIFQHEGKITYTLPNGKREESDVMLNYQVVDAKQSAVGVVTADKMNVVYRGLPNPLSVNMSGAVPSSVTMVASSGKLTKKGGGKYVLVPGGGSKVTLTAKGTTFEGKSASTPYAFRVKNIPPAQGQIRGQTALAIPASSLPNQPVTATIPDFLFDVTVTVKSFKVKVPGKRTISCSGNRFSSEAAAAIKSARGDVCAIFEIKAVGNNGVKISSVSPILVSLQ